MFRRLTLGALLAAALSLTLNGFVATPNVYAAKKKVAAKSKKAKTPEGEPSERQKKLLGWTSVYPTAYTYMTADYFIRGTVADFKQLGKTREWEITILPIEVMNNPMHHITEETYKNGIAIKLELSPSELKGLKQGGIVEFNQYEKELPTEDKGHAKLVKAEIHQEFKPYDTSPIAYLSKPDMEPEQYVNAIRGVLMYKGGIDKSDTVKTSLASLTKSKDSNLSQKAKECSQKLFGQ
ncbi:MAG: hypothetical protein U1F57_01295 [bacterium]